ncbi:MAG: trypsin-like peptidase domain-containing protein [Myxococcales bacterium]|nr:trypsin-like peptidase domain-containing protein [Myxococcales bacterium]
MTLRALVVAALACCVALGNTSCRRKRTPPTARKRGALPDAGSAPVKIVYPRAPGSFVKLARKVARSVVHLYTDVPVRGGPSDWFADQTAPAGPAGGEWRTKIERALGSGFIADQRGHVVTNAHIVGEGRKVWVKLSDGSTRPARVVGRDPKTDLAVLKIDAANLVPLRLGRIDQVSIGEWVVIVSDPFGLGYRVAVGVVSALARKQAPAPIAGYWGYLQTDARIHAGNSGGPVLNSIGEVIGLATATRDETAGVGLVLPVNRLRELVPALIRDGKITRSWIGMYIDKLSADQASKLKRKPDEGAQITGVVPGGPADRAGLRRGDVVLQFDGHAVNNTNALPQLAAVVSAGREVPVKVWRGGKELSFRLRTARMPE